jgi:hypothetical protein
LILGTLAAGLRARVTEEAVTIQLNGLTGLFGEVVDNYGLGGDGTAPRPTAWENRYQ